MKTACPHCKTLYDIDCELLLKKAQCEYCQHKFKIIPYVYISENNSSTLKLPLTDALKKAKDDLKKLKKFVKAFYELNELPVWNEDNSYISSEDIPDLEEIYDFFSYLGESCETSIEMFQTILDDRKHLWLDLEFFLAEYFRKPNKEQFQKIYDYLDNKYGILWSEDTGEIRPDYYGPENYLEEAIKNLFPELEKEISK